MDGQRAYDDEDIDQGDIDELYHSFSGYFTREECKRALVLNSHDLAETCQWLFNEGEQEKDRNVRVFDEVGFVILAESEITSNFQEKAIKGPAEITTKEGSLLAIGNVCESIWTMDREQVTCYSENGSKIFSKLWRDFKKHPESRLGTTLLKVIDSKFPRNPECCIVYDPYCHLFYTFAWPPDGHYFPTAVLVSNDKRHSLQVQEGRGQDGGARGLDSLGGVQRFALQQMSFLDRSSVREKYRFNDWLWYYGQRII